MLAVCGKHIRPVCFWSEHTRGQGENCVAFYKTGGRSNSALACLEQRNRYLQEIMPQRPTLDDLQHERARFIGPPVESRRPKMQRKLTDQEQFQVDVQVTMQVFQFELEADEPIDPDRLPNTIVRATKAHSPDVTMVIVDGRPHYLAFDVAHAILKQGASS